MVSLFTAIETVWAGAAVYGTVAVNAAWATIGSYVIMAASMVYQQQAAAAARKAAQEKADEAKGIQAVLDGEIAPLNVIYGRNLVGGIRVYHNTSSVYYYVDASGIQVFNQKREDGLMALGQSHGGDHHQFLTTQQCLGFAGINQCYDLQIDGKTFRGEYTDAHNQIIEDGDEVGFDLTTNTYVLHKIGSTNYDQLDIINHSYRIFRVSEALVNIQGKYSYTVDGPVFELPALYAIYSGIPLTIPFRDGIIVHICASGNVADPLATANGVASTAVFTNTAYATCIYNFNRDAPQYQGTPTAQFFIEGMKVLNISPPGTSLAVEKIYSNNPILVLLDYLMNPIYGKGLTQEDIDLPSFYNAKVICDQVVMSTVELEGKLWKAKGGTRSIARYECNLALDSSKKIRDNIESILETMDFAKLIWSGGKYKINLQYPATNDDIIFAGDTITDSDIIRENETVISWPNAQAKLNFVTVRFLNESKNFAEDTVAWPPKHPVVLNYIEGGSNVLATNQFIAGYTYKVITSGSPSIGIVSTLFVSTGSEIGSGTAILDIYATYLAQDSGVLLESEIFATGTTDRYHALAKAEQTVRMSRDTITYTLNLNRDFIHLEPGDFIRVNSEILNIPNEILRIDEVKADSGIVKITAMKFDANMLAWNVKDNELPVIHNLFNLNLAQASNLNYVTGSPSGKLTFTKSSDTRVKEYSIKITNIPISKINADTTWTEIGRTVNDYFYLSDQIGGSYTITVVAMSGLLSAQRDFWPALTIGIPLKVINRVLFTQVQVFKRSATLIADPPTGGSYNINTILTPPTSWSVLPPLGNDPLYITSSIALINLELGQTEDSAISWSLPILIVEDDITTINYSIISASTFGIKQDDLGNNFGTASGDMKVIVEGVDHTEDMIFSVISTNCTVTFTGAAGHFEISALVGDLGSAVLKAHADTFDYYQSIQVSAIKLGYIRDITPPDPPVDIDITHDYSTVFIIINDTLDYTVGHGHLKTEVYASKIDDIDDVTTQKYADIFGVSGSFVAPLDSNPLYIWLKYVTKDEIASDAYRNNTLTISKIGSAELQSGIITEALMDSTYAEVISTAAAEASQALIDVAIAQDTADTANTSIADIISDSLLTPDEKPAIIQDNTVILTEQSGIDTQATAYSITTEKTIYDDAISALTTYLATLTSPVLWSNLTDKTTIIGTTFRTKFTDVYTSRQALLNKISANAKVFAAAAQTQADAAFSGLTSKLTNGASTILSSNTELTTSNYNVATNGLGGVAITNSGILGRKRVGGAWVYTFTVDTDGNASFGGTLNAAVGSFAGNLDAATITAGGISVGASGFVKSSNWNDSAHTGWNIDNTGITAHNITIKDLAGNILLSSGGSYAAAILNSNVTATTLGAVKTDLTNAPSTILNSNITATTLGAVKTDLTNAPSAILNNQIAISSAGVLSGAGGGTVTAAAINAVQTSLANAPAGIINSNVTLSTLGAGAFATLAQITLGNAATYIAEAAIPRALIGALNVVTADIVDAQITTAKIADSNITTAKIANLAVTTALIADANITTTKIADANITTVKIADANITTAKIADASITSAKIISLDATKITTTSLSAINSNMGTVTIDSTGYIKGGQTGYNSGTGFFLGYSSGFKFSIGDSSANYLLWDGAGLVIRGNISDNRAYTTGTIPIASSPLPAYTTVTTYTTGKIKEISVARTGNLTVSFDLGSVSNGGIARTAYGKIYKNGTAVGTERSVVSGGADDLNVPTNWTTYTENFSVTAGDLIQVYSHLDVTNNARAWVRSLVLKNGFFLSEVNLL